jgi:hypothetical protein
MRATGEFLAARFAGFRLYAARHSRNQRSADSFVRVVLPQRTVLADKAARAPGKSSQNATMLGDSTAKSLSTENIQALSAARCDCFGRRMKAVFWS